MQVYVTKVVKSRQKRARDSLNRKGGKTPLSCKREEKESEGQKGVDFTDTVVVDLCGTH